MTDERSEALKLESFLAEWYAPAFRTACLVLGDAAEAADAVQDAFLRLWRFRDAMPTGEALRPWCYRVVVNACYSRARGESRRRTREQLHTEAAAPGVPGSPDELVLATERAAAVRRALAELPEALRVPVVLRYYAELSDREIALAIRRRPGTVKSRLFEARRQLAQDAALAAVLEERPSKADGVVGSAPQRGSAVVITDDELRSLLESTALDVEVPDDGPMRVARAILVGDARTAASPQSSSRWSTRRRRPLWVASAVAIVIVAVLAGVHASTERVPVPVHAGASFGADAGPLAPSAASSGGGAAVAPVPSRLPGAQSGRDIVATGTLVLRVAPDEIAARVARLESLAGALGGYVANSNVREAGRAPGGTVVIDVPAARFSALSAGASALGSVRSLSSNDSDVTSEAVDLAARIVALRGAEARLETLASHTGSVSGLLSVENEITTVQSQIDQLVGEQRALTARVRDARLSVELQTTPRTQHIVAPSGFSRAWHDAVGGFLAAVRGLVASLGVVLFVILALVGVALLVRFPGRRAWHAVRRRMV